MATVPELIMNVIGQRGIDPLTTTIGVEWELTDRLDGNGAQLTTWQYDPLPTAQELALAATPLITLGYQMLPTGFLLTATLTGGTNQSVQWRCVALLTGVISLDQGVAVNGVETWEIDAPLGIYRVAAWCAGFGYAEEKIIF